MAPSSSPTRPVRRTLRAVTGLLQLGVKPGDRVAYLSFNNHQLLEGYFGVLLAGAIVMPIDVHLAPPELVSILQHAEPRVLIYESDFRSGSGTPASRLPGDRAHGGDRPQPLRTSSRTAAYTVRPLSVDEMSIAELFYTSGSTGTPKGVMLSRRTLYLHCLYVAAVFIIDDTGVELRDHSRCFTPTDGAGRRASTMMGLRQVMVRRFDRPRT